jgi:hypothetical protein
MSRFFDELEERLRSSTAEQHARAGRDVPALRPRRWGWMRRHRRPLIAVAIAVGGFAVPAVAAVSDLWRPDVVPRPPMRTVMATPGHAVSCDDMPTPGVDVGPPVGADFTSVLGVLARPRTADDAPERRFLRLPGIVGVDVAGARLLGTAADGTRSYLVAARGHRGQPWPKRCLRGLDPDLRRRLAHPPQLREPTVCVVGRSGGGCSSLADVRAHGTYQTSGVVLGRATVVGLAPDGVRAVRVTYGRSTRTFPVSDNFFTFAVAVDVEQAASPDLVEWVLDDGSVREVTP